MQPLRRRRVVRGHPGCDDRGGDERREQDARGSPRMARTGRPQDCVDACADRASIENAGREHAARIARHRAKKVEDDVRILVTIAGDRDRFLIRAFLGNPLDRFRGEPRERMEPADSGRQSADEAPKRIAPRYMRAFVREHGGEFRRAPRRSVSGKKNRGSENAGRDGEAQRRGEIRHSEWFRVAPELHAEVAAIARRARKSSATIPYRTPAIETSESVGSSGWLSVKSGSALTNGMLKPMSIFGRNEASGAASMASAIIRHAASSRSLRKRRATSARTSSGSATRVDVMIISFPSARRRALS